jgi:hypothetical protein
MRRLLTPLPPFKQGDCIKALILMPNKELSGSLSNSADGSFYIKTATNDPSVCRSLFAERS